MKKWFEPDILYLTKYWPEKTAKEIARELNFSESAVSSMASKLGLKKTAQKRRELHKKALLRSKYSFHHPPRQRMLDKIDELYEQVKPYEHRALASRGKIRLVYPYYSHQRQPWEK